MSANQIRFKLKNIIKYNIKKRHISIRITKLYFTTIDFIYGDFFKEKLELASQKSKKKQTRRNNII